MFSRVSGMSRLLVTSVKVGSGCGHISLYLMTKEWMLRSGGGGIFQERRIPLEPTLSPSGLKGAAGTTHIHTCVLLHFIYKALFCHQLILDTCINMSALVSQYANYSYFLSLTNNASLFYIYSRMLMKSFCFNLY